MFASKEALLSVADRVKLPSGGYKLTIVPRASSVDLTLFSGGVVARANLSVSGGVTKIVFESTNMPDHSEAEAIFIASVQQRMNEQFSHVHIITEDEKIKAVKNR